MGLFLLLSLLCGAYACSLIYLFFGLATLDFFFGTFLLVKSVGVADGVPRGGILFDEHLESGVFFDFARAFFH